MKGQAGASCIGPRRRAKCALQKIMPNKHSQNKQTSKQHGVGREQEDGAGGENVSCSSGWYRGLCPYVVIEGMQSPGNF